MFVCIYVYMEFETPTMPGSSFPLRSAAVLHLTNSLTQPASPGATAAIDWLAD